MSFDKQTYNLAKGMYYIRIAMGYFDHIRQSKDVAFNGKQTINRIHGKLDGAIREIRDRLMGESYQVISREMESDVFVFEAINDKLVQLDERERWEVEQFIDNKLKKK